MILGRGQYLLCDILTQSTELVVVRGGCTVSVGRPHWKGRMRRSAKLDTKVLSIISYMETLQ